MQTSAKTKEQNFLECLWDNDIELDGSVFVGMEAGQGIAKAYPFQILDIEWDGKRWSVYPQQFSGKRNQDHAFQQIKAEIKRNNEWMKRA